ncbi:MAG: VOC family protein [Myxococcota bacterium]
MTELAPLGIEGVDSIHYYVHDMERMSRFLTEKLDFLEIGGSDPELDKRSGQQSRVFAAGDIRLIVSQPLEPGGRAWRWLRRHPEGVGTIMFRVADAARCFELLEKRGATVIEELRTFDTGGGKLSMFNITTPFGDTTFRFIQRDGTESLFPEYVPYTAPRGGKNRFGFHHIDHITSNFQTMKPMLLWMEHVMGFSHYWDVEFHTVDVAKTADDGSGLKSVVMADKASGIKFANNEPARPFFKKSQINLFGRDHRGDGVQHIALAVPDILGAVRELRERSVQFMPTPGAYYDALPERLKTLGVNEIEEDIDVLRGLQILVDGDKDKSYMLQIFLKEQAGLFEDPEAGPFFIEILQRKGDNGFGAGNFRALFESIEREQKAEGRI